MKCASKGREGAVMSSDDMDCAVPDDFGAAGGTEISNKSTILSVRGW